MPEPSVERRKQRFEAALRFLSEFTDWEQNLSQVPTRATFDLSRLSRLLARFENPHSGRPVVHVTGTKGKSTATSYVEAILRAHGLSTFRFLSPHVDTVHERLAINGEAIDDDGFADLVDLLRPEVERLKRTAPEDLPSFFECTTVMGFLLARQKNVHVLAIEVGLGGRLDATNVVDPVAAVVTSIGLDHVRILGDTHDAIAREKAGIFKRGRPAFVGLRAEDPGFEVLRAMAKELGCPFHHLGGGLNVIRTRLFTTKQGAPRLSFDAHIEALHFRNFEVAGGASHQAQNALLAIAAARLALRAHHRELDLEATRTALATTLVPGRAEWHPGEPPLLLDGAHTLESVRDVLDLAAKLAQGRPLHLLTGLTRDRDPSVVFRATTDKLGHVTTTNLPTPRTRAAEELADHFRGAGVSTDAIEDVGTAFQAARNRAQNCAFLVVTGSLYLVGAVRRFLSKESPSSSTREVYRDTIGP